MALLLGLARQISAWGDPPCSRSGGWGVGAPRPRSGGFSGRTLGVVGLRQGRPGRAVAPPGRVAFGLHVVGLRPPVAPPVCGGGITVGRQPAQPSPGAGIFLSPARTAAPPRLPRLIDERAPCTHEAPGAILINTSKGRPLSTSMRCCARARKPGNAGRGGAWDVLPGRNPPPPLRCWTGLDPAALAATRPITR